MLLLAVSAAHAQYDFTIIADTISITGYYGNGGAVTIPTNIGGLPVTDIGPNAFQNVLSLTSVTIPGSVTFIENDAFSECTNLTNVTIPDSVIILGQGAFSGCSSLSSILIPGSVIIFGGGAFASCTSLTNATIGNGITSIGDDGFTDCTSLVTLSIPDSVTSIGESAFSGCSSLASVTIPGGVTSIEIGAFGICTNLTAIMVDSNNLFYSSLDGVLFDKRQSTLVQYPGGVIGSYTIPGSVTNIGDGAFVSCTGLTGVYFTGNAPSVGSFVFVSDNHATAYYLPGTTGWGDFTANTGLATVMWNPVIATGDASFGVRTNHFGFNITNAANLHCCGGSLHQLDQPGLGSAPHPYPEQRFRLFQ